MHEGEVGGEVTKRKRIELGRKGRAREVREQAEWYQRK